MRNFRLPGFLIALGYLGTVAGTVAWIVAFRPPNEFFVSQIATTAGYGFAGFACWRWIVGHGQATAEPRLMLSPSRWMAAASVVTAASFAAPTYYFYQEHRFFLQHHAVFGPLYGHYRLQMLGGAAFVVGLLLAGVGFWIASNSVEAQTESVAIPVTAPSPTA